MKILTLQNLKDMEAGTIIAQGVGLYPELHKQPVKWVAKRGGIYDWAIYFEHPNMIAEYVTAHGDKVRNKDIIKQLVPCDNEAFKMYRY